MTDEHTDDEEALTAHLSQLAMTADDVVSMLTRHHNEDEIHPEALPKAEHLAASIQDVVQALRDMRHHEPLAMTSEDVWRALTVKHKDHSDGTIT